MPTLWNNSVQGSYPAHELNGLPGVWRYGARALCCTKPEDVIQLHDDLQPHFPWILEHYQAMGVEVTQEVIWNEDFEVIRKFPNWQWEVFLFSELHHAACPNEKRLKAVQAMNDKNDFIRMCQESGWPVPKTWCFESPARALQFLPEIDDHQFPIYRKNSCSASGEGVVKSTSRTALTDDLKRLATGIKLQLQVPAPADSRFMSVQYRASSGTAKRIGITDQVLDGFTHSGNSYPAHGGEGIGELCDPVAQRVAELGVESIFSFDVIWSETQPPMLLECNPRWTGAMYPWILANRLGARSWRSRGFKVQSDRLSDLDLTGVEYNRSHRSGVAVYSWGSIVERKIGILSIGDSMDECLELEKSFISRNQA